MPLGGSATVVSIYLRKNNQQYLSDLWHAIYDLCLYDIYQINWCDKKIFSIKVDQYSYPFCFFDLVSTIELNTCNEPSGSICLLQYF